MYIDFGPVRPDLTAVDVPEECVGFITGRQGAVLRTLEEEWGTLMFFAKVCLFFFFFFLPQTIRSPFCHHSSLCLLSLILFFSFHQSFPPPTS